MLWDSCHFEAVVTYVFFSFNLPNFRFDPFVNGGRLRSRAVLTGETGGALTLLVSKTAPQGWQSCICSGTE